MDCAPLCSTCGHPHEPGVKCAICGHVGVSQIFQKMRAKADKYRARQAVILSKNCQDSLIHDFSTASGEVVKMCTEALSKDMATILRLVAAAANDLQSPKSPIDFSTVTDQDSFAAMKFGSAVVGMIRYRQEPSRDVLISEISVLPTHRRHGVMYGLLLAVLVDLRIRTISAASIPSQVLFALPRKTFIENPWIVQKLESLQFQSLFPVVDADASTSIYSQTHQFGDAAVFRHPLHGIQTVDEMISFLQSKL